jgi:hypothetical protein
MKSKIVLFILFGWLILRPSMSSAQSTESIAFGFTDQGLIFFAVDNEGHFTPIASLNQFHLATSELPTPPGQWDIATPADVTPSPDNTRIAFTAHSLGESALFIYSLVDGSLVQKTLPGVMTPRWSPNGDAILIAPSRYMDNSHVEPRTYLYKLDTDQVFEFTNSYIQLRWLPDNEHLVYTNSSELYIMDRHEENPRSLTQLSDTDVSHCATGRTTWGNNRIYYSVSCSDNSDYHHYLYSVDLHGNNRLEFDPSVLLPSDLSVQIRDIYPIADAIYLLVRGEYPTATGSSAHWQILRVAPDTEIIYASPPEIPAYINAAAFLASDPSFAVSSFSALDTGILTIVRGSTTQQVDVSANTCSVQWLNEHTLLYTDYDRPCNTLYPLPLTTWLLDMETGITVNMSDELGGSVWLLP